MDLALRSVVFSRCAAFIRRGQQRCEPENPRGDSAHTHVYFKS